MRKFLHIFILLFLSVPLSLFAQAGDGCAYIKGKTSVTGVFEPSCYFACDGTITVKSEIIGPGGLVINYYLDDLTQKYTTPIFPSIVCGGWHKIIAENSIDGCKDTITMLMPRPDSLDLKVKIDTVSCLKGSFLASASGGTAPLDIFWDTKPLATHTPKLSDITTGQTFTVTVLDRNQCTKAITVTMPKPNPLKVTSDMQNARCQGTATGNIYVYPNGNPPYAYKWSDKNGIIANTSDKLQNIVAGDYTVTITDAVTCEYVNTFTIKDAPPIVINEKVSTASCESTKDGAIELNVTGGTAPYTYVWPAPLPNSSKVEGLSGGTYHIVLSDLNGCKGEKDIVVSLLYPYTTTKSVVNVRCHDTKDGEATITPIGGTSPFMYLWSDSKMQTDAHAKNLEPGTYTVSTTDAYGCKHLDTVVVGKPLPIDFKFQTTAAKCFDSQDGGAMATVSGGNGNFLIKWCDGFFGTSRSNLAGGTCGVTVTDDKGCMESSQFVVPAPSPLTIDNIVVTDLKCFASNDGSAECSVSGGTTNYSYSWNDPNKQILAKASNLSKGEYSVLVTDANGCTTSSDVTINEPQKLSFNTTTTSPKCFGDPDGSFEIIGEGGTPNYTYFWTNGTASNTSSKEISATGGSYDVTITDKNSCMFSDTFVISDPSAITFDLTQTKKGCAGAKGNVVEIENILGGKPNYKYSWTGGFATPKVSNLEPSVISATVTDANQCKAIRDITVEELEAIKMDLAFVKPTCYAAKDGQIGVTLINGGAGIGIGDYDYFWNSTPLQTTPIASDLEGNKKYEVVATDASGCKGVASVFLPQPNPIKLTATKQDVKCHGGNDGFAEVKATGDLPNFSYDWNDADNQAVAKATGLKFGSYEVVVTDDNNCSAKAEVTIEQPTPIDMSKSTVINNKCFGNFDGSISVEPTGGNSPYQYAWVTKETVAKIEKLKAGAYNITVSDANNCTITTTFNVKESKEIQIGADVTDVSCFGLKNGTITATASGGTKPYYYSTNGTNFNGFATLVGLSAGGYEVYVKDVYGCIASQAVSVLQPDKFEITASPDATIDFGQDITVNATYKNNVGPVKLEWSAPSNDIFNCLICVEPTVKPKTTATLTVKAVDKNGCKAEDFTTIYLRKEKGVFVPTGFSPNNDEENDKLLVHGKDNVKIKVFRVFDRWGELIFEERDFYANDPTKGWDGTLRGANMPSGSYVWFVEAEYSTGEVDMAKGGTTLVR